MANILFFGWYHLLLLVLTPIYFLYFEWSWVAFGIAVLLYALSGLSVTGWYHRLFSHRTYQATTFVEIIYLVLGFVNIAGSAATWAYDHRIHHAKTDTLDDPYSIKKWFWFAHIGWLFEKNRILDTTKIPDLWSNKWVRWQHQYYNWWVLITNLWLFVIVGMITDWMSAFFLVTLARICCFHHSMFSINSLAHTWGSKTYAKELTAVDNFILAFITFWEGYHNYHHAFPNDYRNGVSWYHFDPTKWLIWILEKLRLAKNLRSKDGLIVRANLIQKDLKMVLETLRARLPDLHMREKIALRFEQVATDFEKKVDELHRQLHLYRELLQEKKSDVLISLKKLECLSIQKELKISWKLWKEMVEKFDHQYALIEH